MPLQHNYDSTERKCRCGSGCKHLCGSGGCVSFASLCVPKATLLASSHPRKRVVNLFTRFLAKRHFSGHLRVLEVTSR